MEIPEVVKTLIRTAAPTLAAALPLPPPFSLVAAAAVSAVLKKYMPSGVEGTNVQADGTRALSPDQVIALTNMHAGDPQFSVDLQRAELQLKELELSLPYKFAELEVQYAKLDNEDRASAREMVVTSGTSNEAYKVGKFLLWQDGITTLVAVGGGLVLLSGVVEIKDQNLTIAVFTLIGGAMGRISERTNGFTNFLFGSSRSSQNKDAAISTTLATQGAELAKAASAATEVAKNAAATEAARRPIPFPDPPTPTIPQPGLEPPTAPITQRAVPAPLLQATEALKQSVIPMLALHSRYPNSSQWALTSQGIIVDDKPALRTPGLPITVRRIWEEYGSLISLHGNTYKVPVETIVATIAVESGGNAKAYRKEPDGRQSAGLMQTLTTTASDVARRPISVADLYDPSISIELGTAYIASQKAKTGLDPILVAAAYNAGSLRPAPNRWGLYCWTPEAGEHLEKFAAFFGDAMVVSKEDGWCQKGLSMAVALSSSEGA